MAEHEFLDGHRIAVEQPGARGGLQQLRLTADPEGGGRPGSVAGFHDDRVADLFDEGLRLLVGRHCSRGSSGDAGLPQGLLHRRLVPTQPGRPHRRPRNPAAFPDAGRGHDVRLDRRLEPIHPALGLRHPHRVLQRGLIGDRTDAVVPVDRLPQLVVVVVVVVFADDHHASADPFECQHEPALIVRETGLDEHDVHSPSMLRRDGEFSPGGHGWPSPGAVRPAGALGEKLSRW